MDSRIARPCQRENELLACLLAALPLAPLLMRKQANHHQTHAIAEEVVRTYNNTNY
jgi:hypothetical protein